MADLVNDNLRELHMRVLRARRATEEERKELIFDHSEDVLHNSADISRANRQGLAMARNSETVWPLAS